MLDGSQGVHRSNAVQYIDANTDLEAIRSFLKLYHSSPNTLRSYEKECLRYCLWARLVARKAITSLNSDDIFAFEHFIRLPPSSWCRPRVNKSHPDYKPFSLRFKNGSLNPDWRPFQGPLSDSSVKVALAVLKSLHNYFQDARYSDGNPFSVHRGRRVQLMKSPNSVKHKALTERQWGLLQEMLKELPSDTEKHRIRQVRAQFIISVFYFLGLRINECLTSITLSFLATIILSG